MNLSVMFRGFLTSCNYACGYCPFAKRKESRQQLEKDRHALRQFTEWLQRQSMQRWTILFTPWGEGLVRAWYRHAITELSHLDHVQLVAAQTNLSWNLNWIAQCQTDKLALWATYHPSETTTDRFCARVSRLRDWGVRVSVGIVGVPDQIGEIEQLRERLPESVYLWVNAQQPRQRPYTDDEFQRISAVDPQFQLTNRRFPSRDKYCPAGETSFTVDGHGDMRRCHFVDHVIGNIYQPDWESALTERRCPRAFCDCFLGKSQIIEATLRPIFGETLLARVPVGYG